MPTSPGGVFSLHPGVETGQSTVCQSAGVRLGSTSRTGIRIPTREREPACYGDEVGLWNPQARSVVKTGGGRENSRGMRPVAALDFTAAPREDRESNLETLFKLWSAHEGSGLPIAVYIRDSSGNLVMKRSR